MTGVLRGSETEGYCRNGEEIGDKYTCTYGCPVNAAGQGICSKVMAVMFPVMEAVRSSGDLCNIGGSGAVYQRDCVPGRVRGVPPDRATSPDIPCRLIPVADRRNFRYI